MFLPINYFYNIFIVIMPWEEQNHFTFGMQKYLKVSNGKAESLKQLFSEFEFYYS